LEVGVGPGPEKDIGKVADGGEEKKRINVMKTGIKEGPWQWHYPWGA